MSNARDESPRQTGLRFEPPLMRRLGALAELKASTKSDEANRALREYLEREERKLGHRARRTVSRV